MGIPKKEACPKKLNCVWWQGSRFGDLQKVEYFFIPITHRSTQTSIDNICYVTIGQINLFRIIRFRQNSEQKKTTFIKQLQKM